MKVRTKDDIIRILNEYDPNKKIASPKSIVSATIKDGDVDITLTTETISKSKRDIIIDGLAHIKKLVDQRQKLVNLTYLEHIIGAEHPVDTDIKNLLGARRHGVNITWELPSGYYVYNIYNHTLMRQDDATKD